jgi:hypothetical protein
MGCVCENRVPSCVRRFLEGALSEMTCGTRAIPQPRTQPLADSGVHRSIAFRARDFAPVRRALADTVSYRAGNIRRRASRTDDAARRGDGRLGPTHPSRLISRYDSRALYRASTPSIRSPRHQYACRRLPGRCHCLLRLDTARLSEGNTVIKTASCRVIVQLACDQK